MLPWCDELTGAGWYLHDRPLHPPRHGPGLERPAQVRALVPGGDARAGGARRRREGAGRGGGAPPPRGGGPAEVGEPVRNAPPPTPERVAEIEETTQHDVIAFLTAWADNTEPRSAAAYVHHGMTSSDLLDTALAVQLTDATDVLLAKADRLVAAL